MQLGNVIIDYCQRQKHYILVKLIKHSLQGGLFLHESVFNKYPRGAKTTYYSNQLLNNRLADSLFLESVRYRFFVSNIYRPLHRLGYHTKKKR